MSSRTPRLDAFNVVSVPLLELRQETVASLMSADHPAFKDYGGPKCAGCGRRLSRHDEFLWWQGLPHTLVYGWECRRQAVKAGM